MTFVTGSSPEDDPQFPEPFLNGMGVGVIIADPYSQRITFLNKRCTALLGYTLDEVSAGHLSFVDLIHPDDRDVTAAEFERLVQVCVGPVAHAVADAGLTMDDGPIIVQAAVPILAGDDERSLTQRVLAEEHRIYPQALKMIAEGRMGTKTSSS